MARVVLAIIAIGVLAMVGTAGLQAALENAGADHTVVNETWTPDAGNVTALDESNRTGAYYAHNATVYDENGTEMDAGTDYEWYVGNGTVEALTGGGLENDSDATVTYSFQQTTAEQRQLAAVAGQLPRLMGLALPLGALLVLFVFLSG